MWHRPTANIDTVVAVEGTQLAHKLVHDQFVKPLQELGPQILMQKVDEAEAEGLLTFCIIPMAHLI